MSRPFTEAFAPHPLNALTLPLVLELDELYGKAALFPPLIPFIHATRDLPQRSWLRAAYHAAASEAGEFFTPEVIRKLTPMIIDGHWQYWHLDYIVLKEFANKAPSTLLEILRRTRSPHIRSDAQESDGERLKLMALAYDQLHRPGKARQIRALITPS